MLRFSPLRWFLELDPLTVFIALFVLASGVFRCQDAFAQAGQAAPPPGASACKPGGACRVKSLTTSGADGVRSTHTGAFNLRSSTTATGGTDTAFDVQPTNALDVGDRVFRVRSSAGTELLFVQQNGNTTLNAESAVNGAWNISGELLKHNVPTAAYRTQATDGASAIALRFGNTNALTNATAKLVAWYSDSFATERAHILANGRGVFFGGVQPSSSSSAITGTFAGTYTFAESIAGNTCVARTATVTGTVATDVAACSADFGDSSLTLRCEPQALGNVGVLVCNVGGSSIDLTGKVVRIRVLR
ncbi:MAG: hypothetical protein ACK4N5_12310 [Myxococcales bacterium]